MQELFANLGLNAKMLAAQIINFAVLFLILRKFAYKPIIKMLNSRREEVSQANKRTEEISERLKDIETARERVVAEAHESAADIVKQAEGRAVKAGEHIVAEAKAEAAKAAASERKQLEAARERMRDELKRDIGATIASAVEKSVGDILDEKAKTQLTQQAIEKAKSYRA